MTIAGLLWTPRSRRVEGTCLSDKDRFLRLLVLLSEARNYSSLMKLLLLLVSLFIRSSFSLNLTYWDLLNPSCYSYTCICIDYSTDAIIQSSLRNELKGDVTLITIAHRLQTIMDSDKIVCISPKPTPPNYFYNHRLF